MSKVILNAKNPNYTPIKGIPDNIIKILEDSRISIINLVETDKEVDIENATKNSKMGIMTREEAYLEVLNSYLKNLELYPVNLQRIFKLEEIPNTKNYISILEKIILEQKRANIQRMVEVFASKELTETIEKEEIFRINMCLGVIESYKKSLKDFQERAKGVAEQRKNLSFWQMPLDGANWMNEENKIHLAIQNAKKGIIKIVNRNDISFVNSDEELINQLNDLADEVYKNIKNIILNLTHEYKTKKVRSWENWELNWLNNKELQDKIAFCEKVKGVKLDLVRKMLDRLRSKLEALPEEDY